MLTLPDYQNIRKIPRHHSSGGNCLLFPTPSLDPPQTFFNKIRKMDIYQLSSSLTIIFTSNTTSIILSMWMLASGWLAKSNFTSGYTDNTLHYHRVCKLSALVPKKVQTVLRVPANGLMSFLNSSSIRVDELFAPFTRNPGAVRNKILSCSRLTAPMTTDDTMPEGGGDKLQTIGECPCDAQFSRSQHDTTKNWTQWMIFYICKWQCSKSFNDDGS